MTCTLSKYESYRVSEITKDENTGRILVRLSGNIATCPDGVLNNSKTIIKDVDAEQSMLVFDSKLNAPVILRSKNTPINTLSGTTLSVGVNAGESYSSGYGFFTYATVALGFVVLYFAIRAIIRSSRQPAYSSSSAAISSSYSAGPISPPSPGLAPSTPGVAPVAPSTTIVNTNGGGSNGFVEGLLVGEVLSGGHSHDRTVVEKTTVIERDKEVIRESAPARGDSYSSDSNDDNSSSYSSDDSSSYSSDSGSNSFGSDSDGSFGSDSSDSGSFGSDN